MPDSHMSASFGSLFTGIGGIDLGLERAGWVTRWQVENDPDCIPILEHHWPDVARYGDITTLDFTTLEPVELIAGGFPCQPFSTMGKQKGTNDDRWLWPYFADAIRTLEPRFVIVENVPAFRASPAFGWCLGDLHQLGFDAEWASVSACSVGAPHLRRRVFVLAYRRGEGRQQVAHGALGDEGPHEADAPLQDHVAGGDAATAGRAGQWAAEPQVPYLADGLPPKLARTAMRLMGNAVVPQVAELVGRRAMAMRPAETQEVA